MLFRSLAGIAFQRSLERRAYLAGEGEIPVERYGNFRRVVLGCDAKDPESFSGLRGEIPEDFQPSTKGKWRFANVHDILPSCLNRALVEGVEQFGGMIKGFDDENALLAGVESRTSSPVRILRDEGLQSTIKGIFPCGEGAGYAGGITSAAMDGIRVAEAVAGQIVERSDT